MKLSNYINIISGGTPKTDKIEYWNGNIPWISIKDFNSSIRYIKTTEKGISNLGLEKSSTNLLNKNDIIISARGTVGQIALLSREMAFNQSCYGIRSISDSLNQLYLFYWLLANKNHLLASTHGAVFDTITKDDFDRIYIDPPNISVQQHIVDTIGSVDDAIEKNEEIIEKLEKLGINLYKKYLTNNKIKLSQVVECINGGAFKSSQYVIKSKNKLITIKNVDDNGFNTLNVDFLSDDIIDNRYLLKQGDLIMTMTGNVGRIGIVDENDCYLNQRLLKLKSPSKMYLYLYIKSNIQNIISLARGTAQKNLSLIDFQNLYINNSIDEINSFNKYDILFNKILNLKIKNNRLKNIKNILLAKFFD